MLLSCGDALIDFLPVKAAEREACLPVVGGSCLNVAVAMARLGTRAGFVGGLSTDLFGQMIARHAEQSGVDLGYATRSGDQTTLAFAQFVDGEPRYAFYDAETASRRWTYRAGSIPFDRIEAVHVGSTTLIHPATAAQTAAMLEEARATTTVSFDPNCRPTLVPDRAEYRRRMDGFIARADLVRMSDADFAFLFESQDYAAGAAAMIECGATLVVVTRGGQGVLAWHRQLGGIAVEAPRVTVADTIGAGDTFQGALLTALRESRAIGRTALGGMDRDQLASALRFAAACAAITCSRPGADPPRRAELGGMTG